MPRVSKEQTDLNRTAIEQASSKLFREKGFNGVSVADLMAAAGLTHGGFYGHFASKDELAAVACATAFSEASARWEERMKPTTNEQQALYAIIDGYLSSQKVRDVGSGCPGAALTTDVAREPLDKPVRAAYVAGTEELIEILASLCTSPEATVRRKTALAQWSMLVGAMAVARATEGYPISNELLAVAREQLIGNTAP